MKNIISTFAANGRTIRKYFKNIIYIENFKAFCQMGWDGGVCSFGVATENTMCRTIASIKLILKYVFIKHVLNLNVSIKNSFTVLVAQNCGKFTFRSRLYGLVKLYQFLLIPKRDHVRMGPSMPLKFKIRQYCRRQKGKPMFIVKSSEGEGSIEN